jgi:hypothetical protein
MISRITGEVTFHDELRIQPHAPVPTGFLHDSRDFIVPGWRGYDLGVHDSDHGKFEVTTVSDDQCRVQLVLLSHFHPFYRPDTPADAERRAFHEGVIGADLGGQREFSWGRVYCRRDPAANKDALIVTYSPGPQVPTPDVPNLHHLEAHEIEPRDPVEQAADSPLKR